MQIKLGTCGYCSGVERAINIALKNAQIYGKVYTYNELIHNTYAVSSLITKGIIPFRQGADVIDKDGVVIISAHGIGAESAEQLRKKFSIVIDATCPFVKKIHEKVKEKSDNGYEIIIIGDKNHQEIIGIKGWCKHSQIVKSAEEVNFDGFDKFFVVCQTTFPPHIYEEIKKNIVIFAKTLSKIVEIFDSICYTTIGRQAEAINLSRQCDLMIVVGDKRSANTSRLVDLARDNCPNVYLIENVSDLVSAQIENKFYAKPGILSGASTPKELTMEVFYRMSDEAKKVDVVAENEEVKQESAPSAEVVAEEKDINFVDAMNEMKKYAGKTYKEGMRLKATVVSSDMSGINVAVEGGGKNDCGFIAREEAEIDGSYDSNNYKVGDKLDVVIIPKVAGDKNKTINLSKKAYDAIKIDDEHVKKILEGEEFTLACTQEIKGGLLGKIGTYTVFVPASHIRVGYVNNLADYVNKPLRLKALPPKEEVDEEGNAKKPRNNKRIVASQRIILEAEKTAREEEFWSKIYEGAIVNGKVKRFTTFGAFVSLKFMDALVHNSDLSWTKKRITDPGEFLEINKSYDFIVLSVDRANDKISLGYKQLQKRPWEIAQEKYPVGTVVKGKVARLAKFGAFVELEPGIDGLVHISQINRGWVANASEVLKEGEEVDVKIMKYEDDKITLSIKELLPEVAQPVEEEKASDSAFSAPAEKPNRMAAFNKRLEGAMGDKNDRRDRKRKKDYENDDEPREYVSSGSGVTLGDYFKGKFDSIKDEEDK